MNHKGYFAICDTVHVVKCVSFGWITAGSRRLLWDRVFIRFINDRWTPSSLCFKYCHVTIAHTQFPDLIITWWSISEIDSACLCNIPSPAVMTLCSRWRCMHMTVLTSVMSRVYSRRGPFIMPCRPLWLRQRLTYIQFIAGKITNYHIVGRSQFN